MAGPISELSRCDSFFAVWFTARSLKLNEMSIDFCLGILVSADTCTWANGRSLKRLGLNSRPGLYLLVDIICPRPLNEADFYLEVVSIRGNTVYTCISIGILLIWWYYRSIIFNFVRYFKYWYMYIVHALACEGPWAIIRRAPSACDVGYRDARIVATLWIVTFHNIVLAVGCGRSLICVSWTG